MRRLLLIGGLLLSTNVSATTGSELLERCEDHDLSWADGWCTGYIQGVGNHPDACIPEGVTNGQFRKVVEKFLRDNPAELHEEAGMLVFLVQLETWPCEEEE